MGLGAPWGQGLQARLDFLVPHELLGILGHLWHLQPRQIPCNENHCLGTSPCQSEVAAILQVTAGTHFPVSTLNTERGR